VPQMQELAGNKDTVLQEMRSLSNLNSFFFSFILFLIR
jgi:hypothetical protein